MNTIRAAKTQRLSGGRAVLNGLVQWHFSIVLRGEFRTQPFRPVTVLEVLQMEGPMLKIVTDSILTRTRLSLKE